MHELVRDELDVAIPNTFWILLGQFWAIFTINNLITKLIANALFLTLWNSKNLFLCVWHIRLHNIEFEEEKKPART